MAASTSSSGPGFTNTAVTASLFGFAKNIALLFHELNSETRIAAAEMLIKYSQRFKRNLSMRRDFDAYNTREMIDEKLPIFDSLDVDVGKMHPRRMVLLDKRKLIDFFLVPVLEAHNGKLNCHMVPKIFQEVTGISSDFLLQIFDWNRFPDVASLACEISPGSFRLIGNQELVLLPNRPKLITAVLRRKRRRGKKELSLLSQPVLFPVPAQGIPDHCLVSQELEPDKMSWESSPQASVSALPHLMEPPVPSFHQALYQPSPPPSEMDLARDTEHSLSPSHQSIEKFPNPQTSVDTECLLPSHELFRPELSRPPLPASKLSTCSKVSQDPLEAINSKLEEIVEELSSKGKFVPVDYVRNIMRDIIQQENTRRFLRISCHRDVKFMEDYSKAHGRVEELINMFCVYNPITTLYELEQALIFSEKVQNFEELHMGPLHKHPKVIDLFKPAENLAEIPKITRYKLRKYLMNYLSKRHHGKKSNLVGFLEFVQAREFAESIFHLCIRITSFPLAVQVRVVYKVFSLMCLYYSYSLVLIDKFPVS